MNNFNAESASGAKTPDESFSTGRSLPDARRKIQPRTSPRSWPRMRIAYLVLGPVAMVLSACFLFNTQDSQILTETAAAKTQTLSLMDKATEPYANHVEDINTQTAQLQQLYDQENARPSNGPTIKMWTTLLKVDPTLPGSGIYPRFLQEWKKKTTLSSTYITDKKQNVSDAYDQIISLESAKKH